jgi:DNA-binding MarR family transcriptional regulator
MATPPELTVYTSYLLRQATLRAQARVSDALRTLELRPPHSAVMTMLTPAPLSQVALSARLQTDRTTMVKIVDELEQMGLVERQTNPSDRRAHDVTLTDKGFEFAQRAQSQIAQADDAFLEPLSKAERNQLRGLLERLIAAHDQSRA